MCSGLKCYTGVSHKKSLTESYDDLPEVQCSRADQRDGSFASTSQVNVSNRYAIRLSISILSVTYR